MKYSKIVLLALFAVIATGVAHPEPEPEAEPEPEPSALAFAKQSANSEDGRVILRVKPRQGCDDRCKALRHRAESCCCNSSCERRCKRCKTNRHKHKHSHHGNTKKVHYDKHRVYSAKVKNVKHLKALKHQSTIKVEDLQKWIDVEQPEQTPRESFGWEKYYDLPAIYNWLDQQLEQFPHILTSYDVGTSYENRTIRAVKLSHKKCGKKCNPTIFIDSSIHSHEWITVAVTTFIFNELLTSNDPEVKQLAENYDWVFVPVINVDGYTYAHNVDRLWRKTRKPYGQCVGADPNRNYGFHHGEVGSSNDPCEKNYAGPSAFSEQEVRSMAEFITATDNIKLYLTFHSYGQALLFPYGYTNESIPEYKDLLQIGGKAVEAIKRRYGSEYKCGSSNSDDPTSGETLDWVYGVKKVPLVYTVELRDKGEYGYILPADQIIPNALEFLDGLIAMVKEAKALNYL